MTKDRGKGPDNLNQRALVYLFLAPLPIGWKGTSDTDERGGTRLQRLLNGI